MQLNSSFSIVFIFGHTWHSGLRAIFEHSSSGKCYPQKCVFLRIRAYPQKCLRRSDYCQKKAKLSRFVLGNARSELSVLVTAC